MMKPTKAPAIAILHLPPGERFAISVLCGRNFAPIVEPVSGIPVELITILARHVNVHIRRCIENIPFKKAAGRTFWFPFDIQDIAGEIV